MSQDNPHRILFVDDEQSILDVASGYFTRLGFEVLTAKNGVEAVGILEAEKIDCCFTDINMPGMNGVDLAEHIRNIDNTLPVVIMTGYPTLDNTISTLKNGVVDFLVKPVNLSQMELCVRRVFSQRKLFVENVLLKKEVESKRKLEKLNCELSLKVDELNTLNRILTHISGKSSTKDVFCRLVNLAIDITQSDESGFYVVNDAVRMPFRIASAIAAGAGETRSHLPRSSAESVDGGPDLALPIPSVEGLVMESAKDEMPLLIAENNDTRDLPPDIHSMILMPVKIRAKVFGVLTTVVTEQDKRFSERDLFYLNFMAQSAADAIENLALYENIYENLFATLFAFVNAIEARDPYTRQHSSRVTRFSIIIGRELGCSSDELETLNFAGHLHDIGKIGIRDDILLKPGRLSKEEFEKIKEHPGIGARIVEKLGFWEQERHIIRCHHERFDGTGYPDGLKKDEIPFLARIMSVADVYDALSSDRAYRRKMEEKQVLQIIREGSGTQFDPHVVETFFTLHKQGRMQEPQIKENPTDIFSDTC